MNIAQSEAYQGDDWWHWAVWIDAPSGELETIQSVTYTLHSSFKNPVREVTDRSSNFRLESEGWGSFTLIARVAFSDGRTQRMKHELTLYYPEGVEESARQ